MRQASFYLIMLLTLWACNDGTTSDPVTTDTPGTANPQITTAARTLQDTCACYDKDNFKRIAKLVPLEVAAAMIRRHKDTRLSVLEGNLNKQDTRFVTYKITDLISYLVHAHANRGADSIRVYYGVHGPDITDVGRRDMQTVLFIPTESGGKDMIIDGNVLMQAFDEGQLCPPPFPCSRAGAILMNTADALTPRVLDSLRRNKLLQ